MDGSTLEMLAGISKEDQEKAQANKNPYAQVSPFVEAMNSGGYLILTLYYHNLHELFVHHHITLS